MSENHLGNDLKIVMVVSHFYPPVTGGEIYNYKLYEYLRNKLQKVDIITVYDTPFRFKGGFILNNIWFLIKILKDKKDIIVIEDGVRSADLFLFNIIIKFIKKIKKQKIKIIPLIHHTYHPLIKNKLKRVIKYLIELIFVNTGDAVIVNSEFTKKEIRKMLRRSEDILIAYPGLNAPTQATKSELKCGKKRINLLFVGSVTERKGVFVLIKSFEILTRDYGFKNLELHIVGDLNKEKNFSSKLVEYCKNKNLNVKFHGRVSTEELTYFYSISDIFVFPSYWEGFGMVLVEAMYHKLPIIATKVGAIPYLVKDGWNGFLVPPNDPKKLAESIKKLINDPALRKKMGMYGHCLANKFDWNTTLTRIYKLIKRLL